MCLHVSWFGLAYVSCFHYVHVIAMFMLAGFALFRLAGFAMFMLSGFAMFRLAVFAVLVVLLILSKQNERVRITFGFNLKNKDHFGIMMYHKNRLIKSYEKVGCQIKVRIIPA